MRATGLALCIGAALSMSGCYVPTPVAHTVLHVDAGGGFELQGKAVAAKDLSASVASIRPGGRNLVVEIEVAPGDNLGSVRVAVAAVKRAKARVAFAGDEPVR